ncbi:molybdopterin-guanine dinucleotide biosynthesis protein B [Desulfosporosinus fructosivorans]|uniref:Molybdopterin-guanine dinucleotide biosynthesis protein B n=1 Tax=Desulfosporosinus fructosivorans TaxID=2018669 RepID=A0A4Z0R9U1_9FIRM|nr:molybdopterin-guanine dinucleotide biosynthesis protein B [Desulfosporosinus fructosivorans]TGE39922.1 molybdopterin-guanine dinucleotide biosynthesis protein B [Desulfosporosinus fructosivorans]
MVQNSSIPVISFVAAKSGSGKTTLMVKVIRELRAEGLKIATIKHDAHSFDMDKPGKDTWRLAEAGANIVAISSPKKLAIIEKVEEKTLDEIIERISGVDLILTEGFKKGGKPSIEVFRSAVHRELLGEAVQRLAIASDIPWDIGVPCYHVDDVDGVVKEIKNYIAKC